MSSAMSPDAKRLRAFSTRGCGPSVPRTRRGGAGAG